MNGPPHPTPPRPLEDALAFLQANGVVIPDPRQVFLAPEVRLERSHPGCVLHPGTRLSGAATLVGPGARVGTEGPAVLDEVAMDADTEVASGFVAGTALLRGAKLGANAHVRKACLLEEEASTAHAVGLKHTVLMSFVTLGSLINFCDGLIAGGTSRKDHTEVGSGFVHFNFTPWGASGDKATATLVGDVYAGALLAEKRIFLGGLSGIAGPRQVGFGAMLPAGSVLRRDLPAGMMLAEAPRAVEQPFDAEAGRFSATKDESNRAYLGNLAALRAWYRHVRLPPLATSGPQAVTRAVTQHALVLIEAMMDERLARWTAYRTTHGKPAPQLAAPGDEPPPVSAGGEHLAFLRGLRAEGREALSSWLRRQGGAVLAEESQS